MNMAGQLAAYVDHVLDFAYAKLVAGERIALVTVVMIDGSSPRSLGDQMVVAESGEWIGYLSGGCIESAIVAEALDAIEKGETRCIRYGRGSKYMDVRLPCGSAIELNFDVDVTSGEIGAVVERLKSRRCAALRIRLNGAANSTELMRHYVPRTRLFVAGVGPAAVMLCHYGVQAGYELVLHSPDNQTRLSARACGATAAELRGSGCQTSFDADIWTAIVFMFHDHLWEQELIGSALATPAFYIGAMGSRKTHQARTLMLREQGFASADIDRIKGPCGLFAGAKTAQSISISILAEILQVEHEVTKLTSRLTETNYQRECVGIYPQLPATSNSLANI